MYFDNKMFRVLNKIKKITKIKQIQSCLKHLKKHQYKNKLKLLGGGGKKNPKLNITDEDLNVSPNEDRLNEMNSNRINTIINSQAIKKKPGEDMEETIVSKRSEKRAEKKNNVDLDKMQEYLDTQNELTYERK